MSVTHVHDWRFREDGDVDEATHTAPECDVILSSWARIAPA